jgi:hypothetical protein
MCKYEPRRHASLLQTGIILTSTFNCSSTVRCSSISVLPSAVLLAGVSAGVALACGRNASTAALAQHNGALSMGSGRIDTDAGGVLGVGGWGFG